MNLHELTNKPGARRPKKRVGCGESSGHGKTSCRGSKGQMSRSGHKRKPAFEGGQMRLIRRMPKRGFNNKRHGTRYHPVNLDSLNAFEDGARVDVTALQSLGLANGRFDGIKILGTGELTRRLTVSAHAFSASAKAKIEAKGGTCEVIAKPAPEAPAGARPVAAKPAKSRKSSEAKS
jgi:large subunit ribosomal protein L15